MVKNVRQATPARLPILLRVGVGSLPLTLFYRRQVVPQFTPMDFSQRDNIHHRWRGRVVFRQGVQRIPQAAVRGVRLPFPLAQFGYIVHSLPCSPFDTNAPPILVFRLPGRFQKVWARWVVLWCPNQQPHDGLPIVA